MGKKIWLILVMIMASFFMPNVYAEEAKEENYYELKLYEKETADDFSKEDTSLFDLMFYMNLLHYSYDENKIEIYDLNKKLLFTVYPDYSVVVNDKLTYDDNFEYKLTAEEKELAGEIGFSYNGIKLLLVEDKPCDSVCIEKVELDSKSDKARISSPIKKKDLEINFNIRFMDVNDFVKYKIVVNNSTDEDYVISEKNNFDGSKYVSYEYSYDDDSNIALKNSKKVMYVTIKYNKQVPEDKYSNGVFTEKNNMSINLDNSKNNGILENPNTGYNLLAMVIILIMVIGLTIAVYKKTGNKKYLSIIILSLALIPVNIYAMGKFTIDVESKITISNRELKSFLLFSSDYYSCSRDYYDYSQKAKVYEYEAGMTFGEWAESIYNVDHKKLFSNQNSIDIVKDYTDDEWLHEHAPSELIRCLEKDTLWSCLDKFGTPTFDSSSLISSDGVYYLCRPPV